MANGAGTPAPAANPFGPQQQPNTGGVMTAQPAVMAEPQVINPSRFTNYGQGNFGGVQQQQYDPTVAAPFGDMQYRPQVEQQPVSFEQWRAQPRMQTQEFNTPERQLQKDQAAYQNFLAQQRQYGAPGQDYRTVTPQQIQERQQIQARQAQMARMGMMGPEQQYYARMAEQQQRQQFNPYQRQNPYQQQRQQFNPYQQQRQQYRQPMGLQSLMAGRGMPQAQPRMSMDMPETFGRERRYDMPARDYSRIGSAGVAAPPEMVAAPAVMGPANDYWANSW